MGAHLVEPGAVLGDRYVVEDLLAEEGESASWRARDRILARSVVIQALPSASPFAAELLAAAKRASRVADPRILQVLDAVDDGTLSYVVREWATGQSLDIVLSEGPLPARRAAWLMREVAGAMANSHRMGLPHRRLAPDTVVITKSSGVKVIGLGTFAALRTERDEADDPETEDTLDLGRLLYACLTARWPGGAASGLPAAPMEHGRLLLPRQVRAGVPRALDAICDRILGQPPRYGEQITTVAGVKDDLSRILSDEGFTATTGVGLAVPAGSLDATTTEPPPGVLRDNGGPDTGEQLRQLPVGRNDAPSSLGRTLMWIVVAVLILGAALLAYLVAQRETDDPQPPTAARSDSPTSTQPAPPRPIEIVSVSDFDPPPGSGTENPGLVPLATDGDPGTAWETLRYDNDPALGGLKPGVGLVLDLGGVAPVRQVVVALQGLGTAVQLRAAPQSATVAPTGSAAAYPLLDTVESAGTEVEFTFAQPVRTRFLLVWLTSLPPEGTGSYRGRVAELEVLG